ncbi:MAG: tetratricopeptide repeat protein, partial [Candidatus Aminicenantes bacterium]|nr:tetratricopeptide repeat protein [Candidatus Aminicenantes bacterium]
MDHRLSSKLAAGAAILLVTAGLALAQAGRGTARINGVVVDAQGNPVAGAKLTLVFTKSGGTTLEATTDKKGEWAVMGVGTGNWDVTVNAEGWIPVTQRIYTSQLNRNPKFSIQLQQKAEGTGIVQDEATFQMLEEGNAFFQEGKYDTALIMYQDFLAKNPGAYQVLLNIGDCHREKGEYDQAIESYNKLIEQADTDSTMGRNMGAKGLAAIGLCYLKQDDLPKAQEYFMKSIEMAPQDENLP